jgi:hypothetical protein
METEHHPDNKYRRTPVAKRGQPMTGRRKAIIARTGAPTFRRARADRAVANAARTR